MTGLKQSRMDRNRMALAAVSFAIFFHSQGPALADEDMIPWPRIGMTGAQAIGLLQDRCPTVWEPPPYLTCIDGGDVVTATISAKNRIYYIQRLEPTDEPPESYARQVAAALGFEGPGQECERNSNWAMCWTDPDGTALFAGMEFKTGILATQLLNEKIEAEDGPP